MRADEQQNFRTFSSEGDDDEVGYGRPPKRTRFKPGQSGYPRGRPKARKTFGHILYAGLQRKIEVTEKGITRKVSVHEAFVHGLLSRALRGEPQAQKLLLQSLAIYIDDGKQTIDDELRAREAADVTAGLIAKLRRMAGRIAAADAHKAELLQPAAK
jgi:hypothetical protein